MQFTTLLAGAAAVFASSVAAVGPLSTGNDGIVWTTETVTAFTTYCPSPTVWAYKNTTYTITTATTITISNCPCTISYCTPAPTTTTLPPVSLPAPCSTCSPAPPTVTLPPPVSVVTPPPTTHLSGTSAVTTGPKAPPSPTASTTRTLATAAANQVGAGMAGLAGVAGMIAYLL